jgi:hypothetical protein
MGKVIKSGYILTFIVLLSGCSLTKHYKKVATDTDVTSKEKAIIAPWVSVHFPTKTEYVQGKTDTIETLITDDGVISELNQIIDSLLLLPKDSAIKYLHKNCKEKVIKTVRVDTVYNENGGTIYSLKQQLAVCDQEVNEQKGKVKSAEEKERKVREQRNYAFGVLLVLLMMICHHILSRK